MSLSHGSKIGKDRRENFALFKGNNNTAHYSHVITLSLLVTSEKSLHKYGATPEGSSILKNNFFQKMGELQQQVVVGKFYCTAVSLPTQYDSNPKFQG